MTINPNIRDQAYQFFVEEAPELLHTLESGLLTLRQERTSAQIHSLMRAAHSIKGGAASVGLTDIATLAHRLENIFKALYSETLEIDADLEESLLQAFDCLRSPLMAQITTGTTDANAVAIADPLLSQIETRLGDALLQTESYMPSAADLGINMVTSIFEVDVAQGLERLATALENPHEQEVAGELRAQIEVFAGFAELLNLPNFGAIATAAQQALDANPDQILEIAYVALNDFEQSRQAVLADQRSGGSGPSESLLALTQPLIDPVLVDPEFSESFTEVQSSVDATNLKFEDLQITKFASVETLFTTPLAPPITPFTEVIDSTVVDLPSALVPTPFASLQNQLSVKDQDWSELFPVAAPATSSEPESVYVRPNNTPTISHVSVRVDTKRLERMNNLIGELAINRNSISLQNSQLQEALDDLLQRFKRFQGLIYRLQGVSEQMLILPEQAHTGHPAATPAIAPQKQDNNPATFTYPTEGSLTTVEFDFLQMDRYSTLHSQMQEILEDMVQLEEVVGDISLFTQQSSQSVDQQRQMLNDLQDEVVWARMLPLSEILNRFPRIVRDLSATYGKPVRLNLIGDNLLIERAMLEKLYDPLLHLLRNAFAHGIEPVEIRQQQGKPEAGLIEIQAYYKGNQTIIEIRDDGQGLNLARIRDRALELDWLSPEQVSTATSEQLLNLIFEPGFSTAPQVNELAGRGVGLDVVQSQLQSIKGTVAVTSTPGQGCGFTLSLPLSLTITKLVICLVGPVVLALPTDSIVEILTPQANQIQQAAEQRLIDWRGQILPIYRLADLLEYACPLPESPPNKLFATVDLPRNWVAPLLVLQQGQQLLVLEVDRLATEQELVIKPFGEAISPPDYIYGCTVMAEGSLVPVIDGIALLARLNQPTKATTITYQPDPQSAAPRPGSPPKSLTTVEPTQVPTILVVDDSTTLRRTMALFLERAGYRVLQARHGQEAIAQLQQGISVQLIVCDLEMPNMNGFEFLSVRRQQTHLSDIPVIILTSRSNDKHQWLAMQLGATAYFTKPYLEQEFLGVLKNLLSTSTLKNRS